MWFWVVVTVTNWLLQRSSKHEIRIHQYKLLFIIGVLYLYWHVILAVNQILQLLIRNLARHFKKSVSQNIRMHFIAAIARYWYRWVCLHKIIFNRNRTSKLGLLKVKNHLICELLNLILRLVRLKLLRMGSFSLYDCEKRFKAFNCAFKSGIFTFTLLICNKSSE